jgi:ABC-2 type transport system permease protein
VRQSRILLGVLAYEFKMQIRRSSLWIAFIGFALILTRSLLNVVSDPRLFGLANTAPLNKIVVTAIFTTNILLPIPFGVFLADRLPRDRRTGVDELFTSMPGTLSTRIVGKYLGSTLATIVPMFVCYSILAAFLLYQTHNMLSIPLLLIDFALIVLPGLLFVAAFSIACPAILWVPLYQFLFIGYWFWGNGLSPTTGIPTLSPTILTPIGTYISTGILGVTQVAWVPNATFLEGLASLLLLLGIAVLVLYVLWRYLSWQQERQ